MNLSEALLFSRYAQRMVEAREEYRIAWESAPNAPLDWVHWVARPLAEALHRADAEHLAMTLRQIRQKVMLYTMARDLLGLASLDEVCGNMCRLAEETLLAALTLHKTECIALRGFPRSEAGDAQSLIIVGMGKLGGGELNVSSDIDLVFLYPEEGETDGHRSQSNHEFFKRLGQKVIATLDDVTADGFVFRVDMRLRPYGDAAPLAVSFDGFEQYLLTQGRMWERYAWLKAKALTGDRHDELEQIIRSFVYRKYLDFDAYEGLRDVREQIRREGEKRNFKNHIKLGSGGIREIEFIAQAQQIVRGGRDTSLQLRGTQEALRALRERKLIDANTVDELLEAYVFLRRLEHRLQYREDQATQIVPESDIERDVVAQSMGFDSLGAFDDALDEKRRCVAHHFEDLLGNESVPAFPRSVRDEEDTAFNWETSETLVKQFFRHGFADPQNMTQRVVRVRESRRFAQLPERSRQRFDKLLEKLISVAQQTARALENKNQTPDTIFQAMLAFLETISRRSAYLALLSEHMHILPMIAQIFAASSWAAAYLDRHPILLDELLMPQMLYAEPDWLAWRHELTQTLATHCGDTERQMDELRHFQHAQIFRLLAQDIAGKLTVERLSDHLTALADLILEMVLDQCWRILAANEPPPRFAIVGYGKLGSKELSYGSDLDLVFLYDARKEDEQSVKRYTRLAQRMNTWLNGATAAGNLYATDLRLRPDGGSGLFVSSWEGFLRYQKESAWTFEHQALTRARFIAGDGELGGAFMRERAAILRQCDRASLISDILAMRAKMHEAHDSRDDTLFNVKQDEGGMIDIEFLVQYLVLANAYRYPVLTRNTGNVALLSSAAALELITSQEAENVAVAYRNYRRLQHSAQLQEQEIALVAPESVVAERAAVKALWQRLFTSGAAEKA
ncbi:MAG: bifunctional [glutamate--ammonia ligase]-adenylyl-L-tyrosine phosphorylase/[glutamate--ammonia-ligase] adenylyltransferase [Burkholderiales bacterium]|jgi:glutamate-ammonia-ligase adenylyltransferase|nr:bifunctional [glutamate--ammonia ligase]-adenylyl-L-tyrosine phosphorylase/[glutamate--ammonia-ligase] adenylyltransferase [Burkholderiales bacterium]